MITTDLLTVAKKLNHYEEDATAGGTHWIDTTHYKVVCPSTKRWFLIGGHVARDVSSTVIGYILNSSDEIIVKVLDEGAATTSKMYPESAYHVETMHIIDGGEYLQMSFGTAQGASAKATCIVLEIDI